MYLKCFFIWKNTHILVIYINIYYIILLIANYFNSLNYMENGYVLKIIQFYRFQILKIIRKLIDFHVSKNYK